MHRPVVLFDYDGVIFRNRSAQARVNEASIRYAQTFLHRPYDEVVKINNKNYQKYGHTVHMLRKMFQCEDASMEGYNRFVFDNSLEYEDIRSDLSLDDYRNTHDIIECVYKLRNNGASCGIFTNASSVWIDRINKVLGIDGLIDESLLFSYERIRSSKPDPIAYWQVESALIPPYSDIFFADDNQKNLEYCESFRELWHPILIETNDRVSDRILTAYENNLQMSSA